MKFESLGMRHLEDENMLKSHGHDAPLKPGQEGLMIPVAESIVTNCIERGISRVDIIASGQQRTRKTGAILKDKLTEVDPGIDVQMTVDERLMDLRQPQPILPENYIDGDNFLPLKKAWEIFWDETFAKQNFTYRFGDCIKTSDGTCTHPDLEGAFHGKGESYAEFCARFYDFLYDFTSNYSARKDVLPMIIGHNATYALLHEFAEISKDLSNQVPIKPIEMGELPNITWEYFDKLKKTQLSRNPEHGELTVYDLSGLVHPEIREIVAIERDVLRAKTRQTTKND